MDQRHWQTLGFKIATTKPMLIGLQCAYVRWERVVFSSDRVVVV
ncbi:MAG: hypothetical protein NZ772_09190 [Cyanobacteria bacterium]|nr:hypothetical protein [Cyanobacteriota bacterium]MDW8201647.1 hypothetical protein [Cyanobacteriota bacterium SKYGB_h_bin112]